MQTYHTIDVAAERIACCLHEPAIPPGSGPPPVVVCCHGLTGSRNGSSYRYVRLGRTLAAAGIACVRFDFRGCGESDGDFVGLTSHRAVADLEAVLAALAGWEECDTTRIGIVASSFGAFTTALVARKIESLKCLAFWAPVSDPHHLAERDMTDAAWALLRQQGWIDHAGLRLGAPFLDEMPRVDAPALLAEARAPLLVLHGAGDTHVPIGQGEAYVSALMAAGIEARIEPLDTDDHGMRTVPCNDSIISRTVEWMRGHLLTRA